MPANSFSDRFDLVIAKIRDRNKRYVQAKALGASAEELRDILDEPFAPSNRDKERYAEAKDKAERLFSQPSEFLSIKLSEHLGPEVLLPRLQAAFKEAHLDPEEISTRIFPRYKLDHVFNHGTDRHEKSKIYPAGNDTEIHAVWARQFSLGAQDLTYVAGPRMMDYMINLKPNPKESAMVFYDQRALFLLGDNLMEHCYAFLVPPKHAMVAVMSDQGTLDLDQLN